MTSKEYLEKYKALYRKKTGKDISDKDALDGATKLIRLVKAIYKPMTQEESDMLEKRRRETKYYEKENEGN